MKGTVTADFKFRLKDRLGKCSLPWLFLRYCQHHLTVATHISHCCTRTSTLLCQSSDGTKNKVQVIK